MPGPGLLSRDVPCLSAALPPRARRPPKQRSSYVRRHRYVAAAASASPGAEQRRRDSASEPQPSSSDASSSEAQEDSGDRGPHDQRPLILRIFISMFMPVWQSICRVFTALPGSNMGRAFIILACAGLFGVRAGSNVLLHLRSAGQCVHTHGHCLKLVTSAIPCFSSICRLACSALPPSTRGTCTSCAHGTHASRQTQLLLCIHMLGDVV